MKKMIVVIIYIFILSCSSTKSVKVVRDHGDCYVATLNLDNTFNDTTRIRFIKGAVFDTTAILVHGYIIDSKTLLPIQNTEVRLFNMNRQITLQTNNQGEFEIFENLHESPWNLIFRHPEYICLYVVNVIQTGGQWISIRLEHK
jgi:hypothetical protein